MRKRNKQVNTFCFCKGIDLLLVTKLEFVERSLRGGYQIFTRSSGDIHMASPGCVPKASWKASTFMET